MKERLTQLGLVGFGKEAEIQLSAQAEVAPQTQEIEKKTFVVPKNTTLFRASNSDLGLTSLSSFYVTKKEGARVTRGMIKVQVAQDGVEVYRDGQRFVLSRGEVVELPVKRLVKMKKDGFC